jgi:hypothetical protein
MPKPTDDSRMSLAPPPEPQQPEAGSASRRARQEPRVLAATALAGAIALFVSLFLPWYDGSFNGRAGDANAWNMFGSLQVFLCEFAVLLAVLAIWELVVRSSRREQSQRYSALPVLGILAGGVSALLAFIHLFDVPYRALVAPFGFSITISFGIFIALAAALVATVAFSRLAVLERSFQQLTAAIRPAGSTSATRTEGVSTRPQNGNRAPAEQATFLDELDRLAHFQRTGILTEEEFLAAKRRLLGDGVRDRTEANA